MIQEYKILVAAKTINNADLPANWQLGVHTISKSVGVVNLGITCCAAAGEKPTENYTGLSLSGKSYGYDSAADATMLANTLEGDLIAWFGVENTGWQKI